MSARRWGSERDYCKKLSTRVGDRETAKTKTSQNDSKGRRENKCKQMKRRKLEEINLESMSDNSVIDVGAVHGNPEYKYQLTKKMLTQIQRTRPVISSRAVEHILKHGRPPFEGGVRLKKYKLCNPTCREK